MFALKPTETVLEGQWQVVGGKTTADDVALRIDRLVAAHLLMVAAKADGWSKLFRGPADGRLWEITYPKSEMHGGGPARLEVLSQEAARARYGPAFEV
jgi:Immunity protein 27